MSYGSDIDALAIFTALTADDTITVPSVDLTAFVIPGTDWLQSITKLTNADVTTKSIDGTGAFDVFMSALAIQLKGEYNANRITGAEYTKAYIAMAQTAIGSAIQFVLGKDQAFWQAMQAQAAAITARVDLETAKLRYAALQLEVLTNKANYALMKIKLATEDINYGATKYNLDNMLPAQLALTTAQTAQVGEQTILTQKQQVATVEQTEATRAQTMDVRLDGVTTIVGVLGKQKDLYTQQITSYKRDAEVKAGKIFSDAWITMLTINETIPVPDSFANTNLEEILGTIKANNSL